MVRSVAIAAAVLGTVLAMAPCADAGPPSTFGWRGNWTGLYPEADPPVEWSRQPEGVVAGPMTVADSVKDFDQEQLAGEASLRPAEGDNLYCLGK